MYKLTQYLEYISVGFGRLACYVDPPMSRGDLEYLLGYSPPHYPVPVTAEETYLYHEQCGCKLNAMAWLKLAVFHCDIP